MRLTRKYQLWVRDISEEWVLVGFFDTYEDAVHASREYVGRFGRTSVQVMEVYTPDE